MTVDPTKTAPWSADTITLLTRTLSHTATATIVLPSTETIVLDITGGSVDYDETRSPRVTARLDCRVPNDQATLDRIDPRTGARLLIEAGYVRPDGLRDVQPLVNLGLRSRLVSRPGDRMTLEAASDEALMIDGSPAIAGTVTNATTTGAITAVINQVVTTTPTVTIAVGPAVAATPYQDRWNAALDLADRIEARVFDNGLRQWFIAPVPTVTSSAAALDLNVGDGGTVISSDTTTDRDSGFANLVWIEYKWTVGTVDNVINASKYISSGPYAYGAGNYKGTKVTREVATTQANADLAATSLVRRTITRGRSFELEAISAYWLRPGHTVTVDLPLGDPENHLVSAVTFDLSAGTMRVKTRMPDGTYTIT